MRKRAMRAWILGAVVAALVGAAPAAAQAPQTPKKGGVLRVGMLGEPPSLDLHWTTAAITDILANHIYEGLYTLDENRRPIPMLAEGIPAVSADGLTYTFKLRQGIRFHREQQTRLFYEKVPVIAYGDLFGLRAARKAVKGFDEKTDRPRFYNVWLDK